MEIESKDLPTYESFIYALNTVTKTCDKFEQLGQGTQQVVHIVLKIDKHPIIHSTIQQDKEGIVEKINDDNAHLHSTATQQEKLPRDIEDSLINSDKPKTMKLIKYHKVILKHS